MNKLTKRRINIKRKDNFNKKLALQILFSLVLVAAVIVTKQVDSGFSDNFMEAVEKKVTESINPGSIKEKLQNFAGYALDKLPFVSGDRDEYAAPVSGTIKQKYGLVKSENQTYYSHGIDIISNTEAVKSISKGKVSEVGKNDKLSNYIVVDKEEKSIIYGNMSEVLVKEGDEVSKGDIIGALNEENKMLHLEVWEQGESVNPSKLFNMDK
jgi:murein DD-endopeptidase MepM/ murein hydrolase activator NlpD